MQNGHDPLCGLQFSCNDWDMDELSSAYLLEKLAWAERAAGLEGDDKQVRPVAARISIHDRPTANRIHAAGVPLWTATLSR